MTETRAPQRLSRFWLYAPFAIGAVILFAYFLLWRSGAERIKAEIVAWTAAHNEAGFTAEFDDLYADGFPFFLRVHIAGPVIADPQGRRWSGERLTIDALPYQLDRLIFSATGAQVISAPEIGAWTIDGEALRASIRRDKARGWVFSASAVEIAALSEIGEQAALGELIFDFGPAGGGEDALVLSLQAARGAAPGRNGETVSLEFLRTVLIGTQASALSLGPEPWRQAGGQLVVNGLHARLDEADITLQGELSIDDKHDLAGRLQTDIANPAAFALLLGKTGALTAREARAASAGLSLLSLGNAGKIGAPINFRNGQAEIAGVKIADTPKID